MHCKDDISSLLYAVHYKIYVPDGTDHKAVLAPKKSLFNKNIKVRPFYSIVVQIIISLETYFPSSEKKVLYHVLIKRNLPISL